jgi:dipeptidase
VCDTFVALKNSTEDGSTLFAKNSDRFANEAHVLLYFPRQTHDSGELIRTTNNLAIPQVEETYSILLSAPFWLYGCEMGTNEFGVTIGNEAVFTKEVEQEEGLIGMDFIRLALERSKTASEALDCIINLLAQYGQGGNHHPPSSYVEKYHNSWIITDSNEAWVLESADKWWIAEKVNDIRTISNALTIGTKYDRIHPKLIEYAKEKGYCKSKKDFNWVKSFTAGRTDKRTWGGKGLTRYDYTTRELKEKKGEINVSLMISILRYHNIEKSKKETWNPSKGGMDCICIHEKPLFVPTQTTASMVSKLISEDTHVHWVTGTSAPCTSLFKPVFIHAGLPNLKELRITPNETYDDSSLWWMHERVHRAVLEDYPERIKVIQPDIMHYEEKWIKRMNGTISNFDSLSFEQKRTQMEQITKEAFIEAIDIEKNWINDLTMGRIPINKRSGGFFYRRHWNKENKKAKFHIGSG